MSKQEATRLADALEAGENFYHESSQRYEVNLCAAVDEAAALLRRWPDGEPLGTVTVRRLSQRFANHHDQYTFYPWGQPPYLDNVDECHIVYTAPVVTQHAERISALEASLEQARVALRGARASLHGHGYNAGIIAKVDAALRAIEEVKR